MEDALSFAFLLAANGGSERSAFTTTMHFKRQTSNSLFTVVCVGLERCLNMTKWKRAEGAESGNLCV
jgi:hypothetical protein